MMHSYITSLPGTSEALKTTGIHPPRRMRAVLEMIVPQVHEGDHETTAEILHTGSQESLAVELVRLVIYLETNNMIHQFEHLTGCKASLSTPTNIMEFLRCMGFLTNANISWLGASANPTNQVFLERLLGHSIVDEASFDVLGWLIPRHFDINHHVRISEYYWPDQAKGHPERIGVWDSNVSPTLLQASSLAGNIHAVHLLLDLGADPYNNGGQQDYSPMECAASLAHHDRANVIAGLLFSKPTRTSSESQKKHFEASLHLAIARNNTKLILTLLSERQHLDHGKICSQHFTTAAEYADCDTIRLLAANAASDGDGAIMLPQDILFWAVPRTVRNHDAERLFNKLNCLLELGADPVSLRCRNGCERNSILHDVIWSSARWTCRDERTREDWALTTTQLMRKHGCAPERLESTSRRAPKPSTLEAAIRLGYPRLVEYLLDWEADTNSSEEGLAPRVSACKDCDSSRDQLYRVNGHSPLLTALEHGEIGISKILLTRHPDLKLRGGEQKLAMEGGDDVELVLMLLKAGSANVDGWKDFFEQAILRRNMKSTRLLMSMDIEGRTAIDNTTMLRAALVTEDHDMAYAQIALCGYDSQTLFEAVIQSYKSKNYDTIVERILKKRPNTPNDDFEVLAVAFAAIHSNMAMVGVLMERLGQGPWASFFPRVEEEEDLTDLFRWTPDDDDSEHPVHILNFAANLSRYEDYRTVLEALLTFNIPVEGMHLSIDDDLTAETWEQLIAAGADPNLSNPLVQAVGRNMLAHVEVLCRAGVLLDKMHHMHGGNSRNAVQAAVERSSPEMLQMLLHYGADVEHPAGYYRGATCLQLAAGAGNIGLVRLLLDKGAKVNAKRALFHGRTAIETAAENERLDVLKLLLLQEGHLFQTAAERYQFIRAAKMAESRGDGPITEMLRQHINWDSNDQQLFDEIQGSNYLMIHLDEMTQRLLASDKSDPYFKDQLYDIGKSAGFENIYDIDGIEEWIGAQPEEGFDDWVTSVTGWRSGDEDNIQAGDSFATSQGRYLTNELPVAARDPQSDVNQTAELISAYGDIESALVDPTDVHGDLIGEQSAGPWRLSPDTWESTQASAPQALRYQDNDPVWLEMQDNDIDNMMQDLLGGLGKQGRILAGLAHRPAAQNACQKSATVLGEVLDEVQHVNTIDDDTVYHNSLEDIGKTDHSHVAHFDWGFWDDESFALHSGQVGYW